MVEKRSEATMRESCRERENGPRTPEKTRSKKRKGAGLLLLLLLPCLLRHRLRASAFSFGALSRCGLWALEHMR